MPDQPVLKTLPKMTETPRGDYKHVEATAVVQLDGGWFGLTTAAIVPAALRLEPRLAQTSDGFAVLDLVDLDGNVRMRTMQMPRSAGKLEQPWPRTQTIPPGAWTKLEDWEGSVLNETDAPGTVTVDVEGELSFSVPMRLRHEPEPNYDSWGEDV